MEIVRRRCEAICFRVRVGVDLRIWHWPEQHQNSNDNYMSEIVNQSRRVGLTSQQLGRRGIRSISHLGLRGAQVLDRIEFVASTTSMSNIKLAFVREYVCSISSRTLLRHD
jgi:hypothetical protein